MMSFPNPGVPFTLFHKLPDQLDVLLEAAVLSDERIEEMELVGIIGEGALSLLQL